MDVIGCSLSLVMKPCFSVDLHLGIRIAGVLFAQSSIFILLKSLSCSMMNPRSSCFPHVSTSTSILLSNGSVDSVTWTGSSMSVVIRLTFDLMVAAAAAVENV